jgi:hypothetical protein
MLFDEANNLVKISNSPLRKEFIIDSINTTPNTFVQMTNANFDATVG